MLPPLNLVCIPCLCIHKQIHTQLTQCTHSSNSSKGEDEQTAASAESRLPWTCPGFEHYGGHGGCVYAYVCVCMITCLFTWGRNCTLVGPISLTVSYFLKSWLANVPLKSAPLYIPELLLFDVFLEPYLSFVAFPHYMKPNALTPL